MQSIECNLSLSAILDLCWLAYTNCEPNLSLMQPTLRVCLNKLWKPVVYCNNDNNNNYDTNNDYDYNDVNRLEFMQTLNAESSHQAPESFGCSTSYFETSRSWGRYDWCMVGFSWSWKAKELWFWGVQTAIWEGKTSWTESSGCDEFSCCWGKCWRYLQYSFTSLGWRGKHNLVA